jgi:hypothetical protein
MSDITSTDPIIRFIINIIHYFRPIQQAIQQEDNIPSNSHQTNTTTSRQVRRRSRRHQFHRYRHSISIIITTEVALFYELVKSHNKIDSYPNKLNKILFKPFYRLERNINSSLDT